MGNKKEDRIRVLGILFQIEDKKLCAELANYYTEVLDINEQMIECLDLLDDLYSNPSKDTRNKLRKIILDNFNDLPRETEKLFERVTKIIKEE